MSETIISYRCPFCGQPLRNTGLGELEAEIERREQAISVTCERHDLDKWHPGLLVHIRHGEREEDRTDV